MKRTIFTLIALLGFHALLAQNTITLTFTGRDADNRRVQLDNVVVSNLTRNWQETLYRPDTTLTLTIGVGIEEFAFTMDGIEQNYPNPCSGQTDVNLTLPSTDAVAMQLYDVNSRLCATFNKRLDAGQHRFSITLSTPQTYLLKVTTGSQSKTIKMVNIADGGRNSIEVSSSAGFQLKGVLGISSRPFMPGDEMQYIGYSNGLASTPITQAQQGSELITLTFVIPVPPTVITSPITNITTSSATCGGNVTDQGSAPVIVRGVCWSTSQNPTVSGSHTTDGSGTGIFTSSITGLAAYTTYYVRAYATNSAGTSYGEELSFTTEVPEPQDAQPCPGTPTAIDHQGNVYSTVQIGTQCWMAENMRCTTSPTGKTWQEHPITSTYTPFYAHRTINGQDYDECYYNWAAAIDYMPSYNDTFFYQPAILCRGICPEGWHIPTTDEWTTLTDYVGNNYACSGNYDNNAKALASQFGWGESINNCAIGNMPSNNNATGFGAYQTGHYSSSTGGFNNTGYAYFWGGGQNDATFADNVCFLYDRSSVHKSGFNKRCAFSVRCLKDYTEPFVTTSSVTNITSSSAICGGNVIAQGSSVVTERGVCWSTSQNPTISNSHTTDGSGTGTFTSNITGLSIDSTYYVRAYATNSAGTSYGLQVSFPVLDCPSTVTDHQGNVYSTVQIGTQCWMAENMRCTTSPTGKTWQEEPTTALFKPHYVHRVDTMNGLSYDYCNYNWAAAIDYMPSSDGEFNYQPAAPRRGICPQGWHIPTDAEWTTLTDYVRINHGCDSGYNSNDAKALASQSGWYSSTVACAVGNNPSDNNVTGFDATPCSAFGARAYFWSATQCSNNNANYRRFTYDSANVSRDYYYKIYALSVRCLKD